MVRSNPSLGQAGIPKKKLEAENGVLVVGKSTLTASDRVTGSTELAEPSLGRGPHNLRETSGCGRLVHGGERGLLRRSEQKVEVVQ